MDDWLVRPTAEGLYCERGGFHIDPMRKVPLAVVTHAHSDHARRGCEGYVCTKETEPLLRSRLSRKISVRSYAYGERFRLGEVEVSFHSAGHILGSAQVRMEVAGEVWVAGGDYKRAADRSCAPFEVVPCDTFITEATFGVPVYRWPSSEAVAREIFEWWRGNAAAGRASILYGYSLGKTQRILAELARWAGPEERALVHDRVEEMTRCYREAGRALMRTVRLADATPAPGFAGELIVVPPGGAVGLEGLGAHETAFASGWTRVRGGRGRRNADRGFVMSDHADWPSLLKTVEDSGASRVLALYGYPQVLARYLREERGLEAHALYVEEAG